MKNLIIVDRFYLSKHGFSCSRWTIEHYISIVAGVLLGMLGRYGDVPKS